MDILPLSLIQFPVSTLLLSKSPYYNSGGLFYFRLKRLGQPPMPGVLAFALLSEAVHSFVQAPFVGFTRQHALTFVFLIMQV